MAATFPSVERSGSVGQMQTPEFWILTGGLTLLYGVSQGGTGPPLLLSSHWCPVVPLELNP